MWGQVQDINRSELTLDIEELRVVAGYAHWIPQLRRLYLDYFEKALPGWTWNQIIPILIKMNILVPDSKDSSYRHLSQGLYISNDIERVKLWIEEEKVRFEVTRNSNQERIED